ncbi:MAG: methyltransferase domain-containing protein [Oscillospiraceae bacterium]|nr:methyltransferase domain-containing protein [Oscillospiraceae bacterium]
MNFFSKLFRKIMKPLYEHVDALCLENRAEIEQLTRKCSDMQKKIDDYEREAQRYNELYEKVNDLSLKLESYEGLCENVRNLNAQLQSYEGLSENVRNLNAQLQSYEGLCINVRNLNSEISRMISDYDRVNYIVSKLNKPSAAVSSAAPVPALEQSRKASSDEYSGIDYFRFENYFRGSRETVKQRQETYLEYFRNCRSILDIGCGRGEFLELMRDNGLSAVGVDTYPDFAEYCCSLGLNAVCDDGIGYLSRLESVDGIFVGQVVEHLTVDQIINLIETAYSKLSDNGVIIMETPNPQSLSIYVNAFYIDPSHVKPVHPETLKYLLKNAGFSSIETVFTESSKPDITIPPLKNEEEFNTAMATVQNMLFGSQDYAVIARKKDKNGNKY